MYPVPKLSFRNDKIFEEDIFFRRGEFLFQLRAVFFARRKVLVFVTIGCGHGAFFAHQFRALLRECADLQESDVRVRLPFVHLHDFGQVVHQVFFQFAPRVFLPAEYQVKTRADRRYEQNGHDPGDLVFRVHFRVDNVKHEHDVDDQKRGAYIRPHRRELHGKPDQRGGDDRQLQKEQDRDEKEFACQELKYFSHIISRIKSKSAAEYCTALWEGHIIFSMEGETRLSFSNSSAFAANIA